MKNELLRFLSHSLLLVFAISILGRTVYSSDRDLVRFKQEYPKALARFDEALSHVKAKGHAGNIDDYVIIIQNKLKKIVRIHSKSKEGEKPIPEHEFAMVIGKNYAFQAAKHYNEGSQFVLTDLYKNSDQPAASLANKEESEFIAKGGNYIYCSYMTKNINLKFFLDSGYYKILSCKLENDAAVIRFTNANSASSRFTGEMELLPKRNWALRKLTLDVSAPVTRIRSKNQDSASLKSTTTVEYGEEADGIPMPKSIRIEGEKDGPNTCTFDEFALGAQFSESEFTPRHFGLPDVDSPATDPQRVRQRILAGCSIWG